MLCASCNTASETPICSGCRSTFGILAWCKREEKMHADELRKHPSYAAEMTRGREPERTQVPTPILRAAE